MPETEPCVNCGAPGTRRKVVYGTEPFRPTSLVTESWCEPCAHQAQQAYARELCQLVESG